MAKIPVFFNAPAAHTEATARDADFKKHLAAHTFDHEYGGADYAQYNQKAINLFGRNSSSKVFVATCWPTTKALMDNVPAPKKIVFAGLIERQGQTYPAHVTGRKSFDPGVLCPFWPALLAAVKAAVASGLKKVAVIVDTTRPGMTRQFDVINANINKTWGFDQLKTIPADDPKNQFPTNPDITVTINNWLTQEVQNNPAGIIVTAGTRTTILRDEIIAAVKTRNMTANKLFAIYPSTIFTEGPNKADAFMTYGPDVRKLYQDVAKLFIKPIMSNPESSADRHES